MVVIKTTRYFRPCSVPPKGLLKSHRRVLVDESEAENPAFLYPSWARNMYRNAIFQIFLLFGRLVLEKLNENAAPSARNRGGGTVFLAAVPTLGTAAGCGGRPAEEGLRRRGGPPGSTWGGDTVSRGLKPVLLSIHSNPRLLGGTTEKVMGPWRRDGRSQPVWGKAEDSVSVLLILGLRTWLLLQKSSLQFDFRLGFLHGLHFPEEKGRDRS